MSKPSSAIRRVSFELFLRKVMEIPAGFTRDEIDLFFSPLKSDPKINPLDIFDQIHHDYATASSAANKLTTKFVEMFSEILDTEPRG